MKKSVKRILCGALSLTMASTLFAERILSSAERAKSVSQTVSASVSYQDVTGSMDTSALRESYFNTAVESAKETKTATYETRTVIVTLEGGSLADNAGEQSVSDYVQTWEGQRASAKILSSQNAFFNALSRKGIAYKQLRSYDAVLNGVAIEVNTRYVSEIKQIDGVKSAVITTSYSEPKTVATTGNSKVVTNETSVYATGIYDSSDYTTLYGQGMVVAVLDTGLDYTHPAFQGFESENVEFAWTEDTVKELIVYVE